MQLAIVFGWRLRGKNSFSIKGFQKTGGEEGVHELVVEFTRQTFALMRSMTARLSNEE